MKKSLALFLFFCFSSLLLQAQSNFKPGLLVTSSGDTLTGFIDYREWLRTPSEFTFRQEANSPQEQKALPTNSQYIQVNGLESYLSAVVRMSMAPVDLRSNIPGTDTTTQVSPVFLKVLATGPHLYLFSYKDKVKTRFYIKESQTATAPQELGFRKYVIEGEPNRVTTDALFTKQLWNVALKHPVSMDKFQRKAMTANYTEKDLLELVSLINGVNPASKQKSSQDYPRVRALVGIWLNRSGLTQLNRPAFENGATYSSSFSPMFSLGFDAFVNPTTQRLLLRTEVSFTTADYEATSLTADPNSSFTYQSHYKLSQRLFSINPQALYNLYNKNNFKFYLAVGVIGTYSTYSGNVLTNTNRMNGEVVSTYSTEDYLMPQSQLYSFTARAGVAVWRKLDFSVLYTTYNITRSVLPVNNQLVAFGASYLFSK